MKKRIVLNSKGMIMYFILALIAIFFAVIDTNNITTFLITKLISVIIMVILLLLSKYIASKYLED